MSIKSLSHSSLTDNLFYRSMLAGNQPYFPLPEGSYHWLATETVPSTQASATLSNLSFWADKYDSLQVRYSIRSTRSANVDGLMININGDYTTNYSSHNLYADGVSIYAGPDYPQSFVNAAQIIANNSTAGSFSMGILNFVDCFNPNKNLSWMQEIGGYGGERPIAIGDGLWMSKDTLDSITLTPRYGGQVAQYSTFSLYGLRGVA